MAYDVNELRTRFPALRSSSTVHLDGPAGTQVPDAVVDAVSAGLTEAASNVGGAFAASHRSEQVVAEARRAGADLLGGSPDEIVFGANMTTLTMAFSRAVVGGFEPGDRIIVTRIDHDANVTPWVLAARENGVEVDWLDIDTDTVALDLESLPSLLRPTTKLLCISGCSNAFGTTTDLARVAHLLDGSGVRIYTDAVHLVPHERVDVGSLGVDALVCSGYKFYGPHVGMLWARREWLDAIEPYKVRPAPAEAPGKFETGTPSFALLSGLTAAVDHLASLGEGATRAESLDDAFAAIRDHEAFLGRRFLDSVGESVKVWGRPSMDGRVPTFAVEVDGRSAGEVAEHLGSRGIAVWAGHYYAIEPMRRLGLLDSGGLVRIGFVNTTTIDEVDRLVEELAGL